MDIRRKLIRKMGLTRLRGRLVLEGESEGAKSSGFPRIARVSDDIGVKRRLKFALGGKDEKKRPFRGEGLDLFKGPFMIFENPFDVDTKKEKRIEEKPYSEVIWPTMKQLMNMYRLVYWTTEEEPELLLEGLKGLEEKLKATRKHRIRAEESNFSTDYKYSKDKFRLDRLIKRVEREYKALEKEAIEEEDDIRFIKKQADFWFYDLDGADLEKEREPKLYDFIKFYIEELRLPWWSAPIAIVPYEAGRAIRDVTAFALPHLNEAQNAFNLGLISTSVSIKKMAEGMIEHTFNPGNLLGRRLVY